jgi:hypothetical protein
MKQSNNIVEVKRSWWYTTTRSIGMFCYKYWWLILLLFFIILLFFTTYIYQLRKKQIYCCYQYSVASQQLIKLDSLLKNCHGCKVNIQDTIARRDSTSFNFDADYIVLTYKFNGGRDLDTRTDLLYPEVGVNNTLGYARLTQWPNYSSIMKWGKDNTGVGYESVLINLINFKQQFPNETNLVIDMRGFWFNSGVVSRNPVFVNATLYKGGTVSGPNNFKFEIRGYTESKSVNSVSKVVTEKSNGSTNGTRIATLTYDLANEQGRFDQ